MRSRARGTWTSDCRLPPCTRAEAGVCRGVQQPRQRVQGPREAERGDRLLSPGTRSESGRSAAHSNLLYTFHYCPGVTLAALAEAHAEYDRQHASRPFTVAAPAR